MRYLLSLFIGFIFFALPCSAAEDTKALFHRLDSCIELRPVFMARKEQRLREVNRQLDRARGEQRLAVLEKLYWEYYTYRFDSAMSYARQEEALARRLGNERELYQAQRHIAMLFVIGGYYSEAEKMLFSIPLDKDDKQACYEQNITAYWLYQYWSAYCGDQLFSPQYERKKMVYLKAALVDYPQKGNAHYQYLKGEYAFYTKQPLSLSSAYYLMAVRMSPINTRTYASAAYGVARNFLLEGKTKDYVDWLIRSAISDQVNPLKENLALQELAMYLFKKDENNAAKSTKYIYCSMEDAQFYNDRLRMLEISQRLPAIVQVYQQQINAKRHAVTILSLAIALIAVVLVFGIRYTYRQNRLLHHRGREISRHNKQLAVLNDRLRKTDETRGKYMRLFLDLCAVYITKLNNYRKLVTRKVKTHQTDDLLHDAQSAKITEQEAATFYSQFDSAFKELYPSFVEDFNNLLLPDKQITLTKEGALPTELRIYALVCIGVTESAEIATLLFYSPQTIYNYRTSVRKRAIKPETFEDDVRRLGKK